MMKMKVLILLGSLVSFAVVGQQSEVRNVGPFKGVKAAEAVSVYLKKGDKEAVKVEVTGTDLSNVITEVSDGYLRIHMQNEKRWRSGRDQNVKVYVQYVSLGKISASSAANVFSEGVINSDVMEVHASSAANVEVNLTATDVKVSASSAGEVNLEGKTKSIDVDTSSAGVINAYNLVAETAEASASSGGSIKLSVSNGLNAHASSGGSIRYRGNPIKTNTNSSSGGSVTRSN
jgi:hypothetical protein